MKTGKETNKRSYERPLLGEIELSADEVMAVGCKTPQSAGLPGNPNVSCVGGQSCPSPKS